ncbi:MAG: hypothetical protein GDA46_02890 [Bdellovibrionales bacterium]|nr:hypothetical protein [Bdellovibrionales bacterium]
MKLDTLFKQFPSFHKWTLQKKLNEKNLTILTEFQDIKKIQALIQWIENHHVSHSQGIQILELGGELLLMNKSLLSVLKEKQQSQKLIEKLKEMRFPKSSLREKEKKQILNKLQLGKSIKAKYIREKDRTGLQLEFKSFSLKDFNQKIQKLNSLSKQTSLWQN